MLPYHGVRGVLEQEAALNGNEIIYAKRPTVLAELALAECTGPLSSGAAPEQPNALALVRLRQVRLQRKKR